MEGQITKPELHPDAQFLDGLSVSGQPEEAGRGNQEPGKRVLEQRGDRHHKHVPGCGSLSAQR